MKLLITILSTIAFASAWTDDHPRWQEMQRAVLVEYDLDKIKELVKDGVDPNAPIGCGTFSPLNGAIGRGNPEMVDLLISLGAKPKGPQLVDAAFCADPEAAIAMVKSLLAAGVPVNAKDPSASNEKYRSQAIHRAVWRGNKKLVAFLLEQDGIELNNFDEDGHTPLMFAVQDGREDIVNMLFAAGADPYKKNDNGLDAIGVADEQIAMRQRMKEKFK